MTAGAIHFRLRRLARDMQRSADAFRELDKATGGKIIVDATTLAGVVDSCAALATLVACDAEAVALSSETSDAG